ncbi:CopG family transcriptional regulator [Actinomadura flavalba]|uniref:CopG family transcriptional regulator n=1 Tax=Actinomadura flavalba TaxID=1120938 RepID=UPI0012DCA09F|nr:CopG family transcriptional regulator [Actinomadura flavalba]
MTEKRKRGRPATGQVPNRSVRVPDEVWDEAKRLAEVENKTVSDVVNEALRRHVVRRQ